MDLKLALGGLLAGGALLYMLSKNNTSQTQAVGDQGQAAAPNLSGATGGGPTTPIQTGPTFEIASPNFPAVGSPTNNNQGAAIPANTGGSPTANALSDYINNYLGIPATTASGNIVAPVKGQSATTTIALQNAINNVAIQGGVGIGSAIDWSTGAKTPSSGGTIVTASLPTAKKAASSSGLSTSTNPADWVSKVPVTQSKVPVMQSTVPKKQLK